MFRRNRGAVERFEKEFAKTFQAVDAIAFPYGRSAQWAFFNAVGIKGAEIIMPAYTCSVVAHAVSLSGNKPKFIDIDLYDFNMNLDEAEAAINENTRAIIATHTFGYPQNIDRLENMVRRAEERYGHKVWLMQDCCHAFGAEWKGRMIGSSGDVAVYAFNVSKIMTSIFGGMLTFRDQGLADRVRAWREAHYRPASLLKAVRRGLYLLATYVAFNERVYGLTWWLQEKTSLLDRFTKSYHLDNQIHFPPDYLDTMLNIEAAIGLEQLKRYPQIIQCRRKFARCLDQRLPRRGGWVFPPIVEGATYSHYTVLVPNREAVIQEFAERGIHLGSLIQYSIPHMPQYSNIFARQVNSLKASKSSVNFNIHGISKMKETNFKTKCCSSENDVINFYDEYALDWDSRFDASFSTKYFIERRWKSFENAILACNPMFNTALELGVGTGIYIDRCAKIFKQLIAVDGSARMISKLEQRISEFRFKNVQPMLSNVLKMDLIQDSSVDCVYYFGLIEHIINMDLFVAEVGRVLKPGGIMIGVTPNGRSPWYKLRQIARGTGKHCATDHYYTIEELSDVLSKKQFSTVYSSHWGLVPAGLNDSLGRVLGCLEPVIEATPAKYWLGGLTFGCKLSK